MSVKTLTKNEFGLSSKHELWNRIKELENLIESRDMSLLCNQSSFNELNLELKDAHATIDLLMLEVEKLKCHNDFLLSQLSGYSPQSLTIKFDL